MSSYEAGVFDFYDDRGVILQNEIPDADTLPEFVKTASMMGPEDSPQLYALVMLDDGKILKKYATADRGNTWLSTLYFFHTKDNLPLEAQKVAAANLVEACEAFDIDAPDFLFDVADGPADSPFVDVTGKSPPVQIKTASAEDREDVAYAIERADGSKHYPLKDAGAVKAAAEYFDRNPQQFVPRERREFAVKVAQAAAPGHLPMPESVRLYASDSYNPALEGHLTTRYHHLVDAESSLGAKGALVKLAKMRQELHPAEFASRLEEFDKTHGLDSLWDRWVADPWYSTLGLTKVAKGAVPSPKTWTIGEVTVTQHEVEVLAERSISEVSDMFGHEFAAKFAIDPVPIFESLPLPARKRLARLATTSHDDEAV
jgi:hypothetical protein